MSTPCGARRPRRAPPGAGPAVPPRPDGGCHVRRPGSRVRHRRLEVRRGLGAADGLRLRPAGARRHPDRAGAVSSWPRRSAASTRRWPTPTGGRSRGAHGPARGGGPVLRVHRARPRAGPEPAGDDLPGRPGRSWHQSGPGRAHRRSASPRCAWGSSSACCSCGCPSSATGWGADMDGILLGLETALQPSNILICLLGVTLGTAVGVLPGIGPTATVALLLPITFEFDPVASLIMLAGIYYGAQYGGSTTAILLNLPGESSAVVTALDGHQMAKQGRAGPALATAALGSFFAGTVAHRAGGALRATAGRRGPEVRTGGLLRHRGPRPARLHRPGQRVGDQGARHDRARAAARHHRAGPVHRRPALHVRGARALRRAGLRVPGGRPVRCRRDHPQPRAPEQPAAS